MGDNFGNEGNVEDVSLELATLSLKLLKFIAQVFVCAFWMIFFDGNLANVADGLLSFVELLLYRRLPVYFFSK